MYCILFFYYCSSTAISIFPSLLHFFLYDCANRDLLSLTSFKIILLDVLWQLPYQHAFKKTSKLLTFCAAILILKIGEMQHFWLLCFIISRKVKMQQKHQRKFVHCMEKVLWLIECVKSSLWSSLILLTFWPNNLLWDYY